MNQPLQPERVGVVLVHGIGEQRRFEHLDAQLREIARALAARQFGGSPSQVTIEIFGSDFAPFAAEQDTWASGDRATARVVFRDAMTNRILHIYFHEVWWADVNEPFSLSKQFRFWLWGLIIAFIPMKHHSSLRGARTSRDPVAPGGVTPGQIRWVRVRLFGVSFVAVLGAMSVGLFTFLAKRLVNLEPPDFVKVFVNYVAGVKLYNQRKRFGRGIFAKQMDFLDSMNEPPRVSVRRRMIRTIAQAARANYDRWYVVAHSLGTVVAYNGLMESAYAWPGYFDEAGWGELVAAGMAGPARPGWQCPDGSTLPARPVWCRSNHIAYRSMIFGKLHGVLMMGSPLEKFATLWPGRVPITAEPAFRSGTAWLSIYDPLDPVSGILRAFDESDPVLSPTPETIGYAADWRLLISHIRYLTWRPGGSTLADGLAEWLVTGNRSKIAVNAGRRWFRPFQGGLRLDRHMRRSIAAWLWWFAAVFILTALGSWALPKLGDVVAKAAKPLSRFLPSAQVSDWFAQIASSTSPAWNEVSKFVEAIPPLLQDALMLWAVAIALPLIAGVCARVFYLRRDADDGRKVRTNAELTGDAVRPEPNYASIQPWHCVDGVWQ